MVEKSIVLLEHILSSLGIEKICSEEMGVMVAAYCGRHTEGEHCKSGMGKKS